MALNVEKREYQVKFVLFGAKQMECVPVAGPFSTMCEAEKVMNELQEKISLKKGFWSISETVYYTS